MLENEAVERFGAIQGKFGVQLPVERAERGHAVDDDAPVRLGLEHLPPTRRLGRELAHDLLEDVLQRHQALELAVLVDDQAEALAVALELLELLEERRPCRDEVGWTGHGAQMLRIELARMQERKHV